MSALAVIALIGAFIYGFVGNAKGAELGRLVFGAAFLALCLQLGHVD